MKFVDYEQGMSWLSSGSDIEHILDIVDIVSMNNNTGLTIRDITNATEFPVKPWFHVKIKL